MSPFKNILYVTKYKKLRLHEFKRWITIVLYMVAYFAIEAIATANNIEFAVWDTLLTGTILLVVFLFGNVFCGYACFLSRFQEGIGIVGRFFLRGKYNQLLSQPVRIKLKWLKYIVVGLSLLIPLVLRSYNVFLTLFGWFLMAGFLLSLVESRAYCKYFCFVGGLSKIASLKNKKKLARREDKCVSCDICSDVCLLDCDPATKDKPINKDLWCMSCDRCTAICPTKAIEWQKGA